MERLNDEVRDRERVMHGLKRTDAAIIPGYQISHNYMRPNDGLDGKTLGKMPDMKVEG